MTTGKRFKDQRAKGSDRSRPTARRRGRQRITVPDAVSHFLTDGEARQFTASTLRYYRARLTKFSLWAAGEGVEYLDEITPTLFRKYLISLKERKLTSQTQLTEARAIRAWLNFCVAEGYLEESPLEGVKMPRADKKEPQALADEELRALLAAMDDVRDRAMLLTLTDTGLRASEFCTLNVGDLNNLTGELKIVRGKGRKDRTVYVGPRTRRELARYLAEREDLAPVAPLWINYDTGQRLTYFGLRYVLRKAAKRARVAGVTAHALRRTFAINCLRNGMPVHTLARLMGHEDIDVLKHYLAIVDADLRAAAEAHGVVSHIFT